MFQNFIFTMTLTGTVVLILYILMYPLAKRYFSLKWRYMILNFVYVLFHELSAVSEMYCDSIVINEKGEEERRKYGDLILKLATKNEHVNKGQFFVGIANSRNKRIYKRRILEMKKDRKYKQVVSVIMMVFICMVGGMPALAYDSPNIASGDLEKDFGKDIDVTIQVTDTERIELPSDYFFIDDSENVYDMSTLDKNNRKLCIHDCSISGTMNIHEKDGKGECVLKSYKAYICTKCFEVKIEKLKSTVTYSPCQH